MIKKICVLLFMLTLIFTGTVFADYSPESIAKGGTGVVNTGLTALFDNPASVHVDNPGNFSFDFGFRTGIGNSFYNFSELMDVIDALDSEDEDETLSIFEELTEDGLSADVFGDLGLRFRVAPSPDFTGSISGFGGAGGHSSASINPDFFDFFVKLAEFDEDEEDDLFSQLETLELDGMGAEVAAYVDSGFSLSYDITEEVKNNLFEEDMGDLQLDRLTVGGTYHYLYGAMAGFSTGGSLEMEEVTVKGERGNIAVGEIDINLIHPGIEDDDFEVSSGSAVDLGLYGEFNDKYALGFSVKNMIGYLATDSGYEAAGSISFIREEIKAEISKRMDEEDEDFGEAYDYVLNNKLDDFVEENEREDSRVSFRLPLSFQLGGSMEATENVTVSARTAYIGNRYAPVDFKFGTGVETSAFSPLLLRGGVEYSRLLRGVTLSTGIGIDTGGYQMDLAFSGSGGNFKTGLSMGFEF